MKGLTTESNNKVLKNILHSAKLQRKTIQLDNSKLDQVDEDGLEENQVSVAKPLSTQGIIADVSFKQKDLTIQLKNAEDDTYREARFTSVSQNVFKDEEGNIILV